MVTTQPSRGGPGAQVPAFPMARAASCPFDPPPTLRKLHDTTRITRVRLWDGSTPWLVTHYDDQRTLLADPRVSADTARAGYPHATSLQARQEQAKTFINMDDPEHARLRRMAAGAFTVRRIEALRPAIEEICNALIDQMLRLPQPVDLVQAFALPVPSRVICKLLGVPYADHASFEDDTRVLFTRDLAGDVFADAQSRMVDYLNDLIDRKVDGPADDLLSRLASEQVATGALTRYELASMATLLLSAGHETTANMISLGILALLEHPDQLADLRTTDDPGLLASAVDELLRYLNVSHTGRRRVALEDIQIAGHTIHAGDGIVLPSDAANRDPDVFPDPDRLDIHRDARKHLALGFGPHQCIGQTLARVELQVAYGTLCRRIPTLRLATQVDELRFKHDALIYGVHELPITW